MNQKIIAPAFRIYDFIKSRQAPDGTIKHDSNTKKNNKKRFGIFYLSNNLMLSNEILEIRTRGRSNLAPEPTGEMPEFPLKIDINSV